MGDRTRSMQRPTSQAGQEGSRGFGAPLARDVWKELRKAESSRDQHDLGSFFVVAEARNHLQANRSLALQFDVTTRNPCFSLGVRRNPPVLHIRIPLEDRPEPRELGGCDSEAVRQVGGGPGPRRETTTRSAGR